MEIIHTKTQNTFVVALLLFPSQPEVNPCRLNEKVTALFGNLYSGFFLCFVLQYGLQQPAETTQPLTLKTHSKTI